jgi:hypothetical protein
MGEGKQDIGNVKLYKLMINKRRNICVGEHWNEGWTVWGRLNDIYCMAEERLEIS